MAVVNLPSAIRFSSGVDVEQDSNRPAPVRAISRRIEQAHIEFDMRAVIVGEIGASGRDVVECVGHLPPSSPAIRTTNALYGNPVTEARKPTPDRR